MHACVCGPLGWTAGLLAATAHVQAHSIKAGLRHISAEIHTDHIQGCSQPRMEMLAAGVWGGGGGL